MQAETRGAGVEDAPQPVRAAFEHQRMAGAPRRRRRPGGRGQLLDDDLDEPLQLGRLHQGHAARSRSRILASRRMYRASRIGVSMKASTIASASSRATSVDPSERTLAPLCCRAYRASSTFRHIAARAPGTLLAAIVEPSPAPSITIAASASPRATCRAAAEAVSG